jgi:hypothetical protein
MSSHVLTERRLSFRPTKLWPVVTVPLSAIVVWAVNSGGEALRWLGLGGLASAMVLALVVSLEAGLTAMMLFEPLRGFLRRVQYLFLPYSQMDPIHLVTPLVTMLGLAMLLQRRRFAIFRETPLAAPVSILAAIYVLQIFNPLQGGLSVGLSGALFTLVPVAWFYFGQAIKPRFLETVLPLIVALGLITSLYGLYHLAYGFPSFEQYWLDHTDNYNSIAVGHVKRALATYSSAEEWSRYIEVGAVIAFGFAASAVGYLRRAAWFLSATALTVMLLLTGERTAIFGLILGVMVLLALGARSWRGAIARLAIALAPVLLISVLAKAPTNDDMLSHSEDERIGAVLSHTARGTLRPVQEDSVQERFKNWTYLATVVIPNSPLGLGLGATSLGSIRFDTSDLPPVDSYFISTIVSCGLPAALLFVWILGRATFMSWRSYRVAIRGSREARIWQVVAALMPALVLNSVFGNTFTLYSVAPIGWLLVGWISAQQWRRSEARESINI